MNDTHLDRFEEHVGFRLFNDVRDRVRAQVEAHSDVYENESHFYRIAVMRLLHEVEQ